MTAAKHFSEVCREGYSVLGRTGPEVQRQTPWQYGTGYPPSYQAFGRLRFLKTLELAKTINAKRVLEVAAGDGFLSACLVESGRQISVNDLRVDSLKLHQWTTGSQMTTLPGDLFALDPSETGQFDLVLGCEMIEPTICTQLAVLARE